MPNYKDLIKRCQPDTNLTWIYGEKDYADRPVLFGPNLLYPSLCIGFLNVIHPERLHIIAQPEMNFINGLSHEDRIGLINKLSKGKSVGMIICKGFELPQEMIDRAKEVNLPLLASDRGPEDTLTRVRQNIVIMAAPSCSMHGVFMEVFGIGVLLTGQSGIGKSELGLELLDRGHSLIADDVVDFTQRGPGWIEGSPPPLLANLLEVRGIGLIDVKTIFGEVSYRRKMRLDLVIELKMFEQGELMERLPETETFTEVLGEPIRSMIVPVGGGRNLAVLVEAAVRTAMLQKRGINTVQDFFNRQKDLMHDV